MTKPTLYYFDAPGRCEPIRCAFVAGGIDFEDRRLSREEWEEKKAAGFSPSNQMPLLEVDGKKFVESRAILTYVCALSGNIPSTPMEILNHNMLLDWWMDALWQHFRPLVFAKTEEEKAAIIAGLGDKCKEFLRDLNAMIKERAEEPNHILKGKPFCPMDLIVYNAVRQFYQNPFNIDIGNIEEDFPAVYSIYKGVLDSNPKIKEYHSTP